MDRPSPQIVDCPACGVKNFAIDDLCVACHSSLTIVIGPRPKVRRINLLSVMIAIALVAICVAPLRAAPGLSIFMLLTLLPAAVRSFLAIEERKADGRRMGSRDILELVVVSIAIVYLIAICAGIAFGTVCFAVGFALVNSINFHGGNDWQPAVFIAFGSGTIAAGFAIYWVGRRLWPRKD